MLEKLSGLYAFRVDCTNRYTNVCQKYIKENQNSMLNTLTYATRMQSGRVSGIKIFPLNCTEVLTRAIPSIT